MQATNGAKSIPLTSQQLKEYKRQKNKSKAIVQEVIDLEVEQEEKGPSQPEKFMNELAKKCNAFFSWISDTDSLLLAEQLWKQSMLRQAGQRFPELNFNELTKLVDRDWKYMSKEDRMRIGEQYRRTPSQFEVRRQISQSSLPLCYD